MALRVIALAANLGQSLSSAWAGTSPTHRRKPLIVTALFVRSCFIALLGVQIILAAPLWSLALTLFVTSSLRGCFEPVAYALVADVVRDDERISAFGLQRMGTNLGWTVGPALGGLLTLAMPYGYVFFFRPRPDHAARRARRRRSVRARQALPAHRDLGLSAGSALHHAYSSPAPSSRR